MIVWCQLCETNTVDVHPDDALHESFTERPVCDDCEWLVKLREMVDQFRKTCRELAAKTKVPPQMCNATDSFWLA